MLSCCAAWSELATGLIRAEFAGEACARAFGAPLRVGVERLPQCGWAFTCRALNPGKTFQRKRPVFHMVGVSRPLRRRKQ